ncbi:GlcG/HbpS family heme-binding protein [Demequina salsinemoris]|uniref:GlcG/HbpS family heme-binding protein n=1 Tax=Demequina salsinemoris TaxID=577470 RepID=UPI0007851D84|nr:heme-binding protein [Demequina salsinemoris]
MSTHPRDLPLADARRLVERAVDKAEQLGLRGAIAVVGASGALVTASRLDRGGAGGMARARSKAWICATQQVPSAEHLRRMTTLPAPISAGFVAASPEALFPGAGGLPVTEDGHVVGGIAASGATVSPFLPAGVSPEVVSADGSPANPEDLLIAYALGIPYDGQHGDDTARWRERFGELVVTPEQSLGMRAAPSASAQRELAWATRLCDAVIAAASRLGERVSVAVVDGGGDPVREDRMDDAVAAGVEIARATASTAARFGVASGALHERYGDATATLGALGPAAFLAAPGGVPLVEGGRVVGGLGVGGASPDLCARLAAEAAA